MLNVPAPFVPLDVSWNRIAENTLLLRASAGYAHIKFGPNFPGGSSTPTGLANDATVYTATVRIDGTNRAVSIVGSAAQTFTTLMTELNTDLSTWSTVVLDGDTIKITSLTTGATSAVFVSDSGANFLFASLRGTGSQKFGVTDYDSTRGWFNIAASTNRVGTSVRGNSQYLRWDKMRDFTNMQEDISDLIDAFLAAAAANTNVKWQNAAAGIVVPTGLPNADTSTGLLRTTIYQLRVNLNGAGNVTVFIDLNIPQTTGVSFNNLVAALNTGLKTAGLAVEAVWRPGYSATVPPAIVFTAFPVNTAFTATSTGAVLQGTTSSIVLTDGATNGIVAALAAFGGAIDAAAEGFGWVDFHRVNAAAVLPATVPGVAAGSYDFTVTTEDGAFDVTVVLAGGETMTAIAALMQTALQTATGEAELVTAVGSKFLFVNDDAGFNSGISVTIPTAGLNSDLFQAIATALDTTVGSITTLHTFSGDGWATPGVDGTTNLAFPKTYNGVVYNNWLEFLARSPIGGRLSMQFAFGPTGYGPLFTSDGGSAFEKELRPASRGQCIYGQLYWDGAAYRYFVAGDSSRVAADDISAGTNNPPQADDNGL